MSAGCFKIISYDWKPIYFLAVQRSGMLLPYMCCPPTPLLVSPVLAGRLQRISPTWEQLEAGVLVVIITLLLWGLLWIVFGAAAGPCKDWR